MNLLAVVGSPRKGKATDTLVDAAIEGATDAIRDCRVRKINLCDHTVGFCRNCLANWYQEAAAERLLELSKDEAREAIYGMPYEEWKAAHQAKATPDQLAAFAKARKAS